MSVSADEVSSSDLEIKGVDRKIIRAKTWDAKKKNDFD